MLNEEKYKGYRERSKAFVEHCLKHHNCVNCTFKSGDSGINLCVLKWLADEYQELDLPFKVQPIFGGGSIIVETVKGSKVIDEVQGLTAQRVCSALNDAAIAWHKHMAEKGE